MKKLKHFSIRWIFLQILFIWLIAGTCPNSLSGQCLGDNGAIKPVYYNMVVWMDNTFVNQFGGNAQAAKDYALPKVNTAINALNTMFLPYALDFRLIFFPTNSLAPPLAGGIGGWTQKINKAFDQQFPCIKRDCIVVLTTAFSTGGGHGNNNVALVSSANVTTYIFLHEVGHNLGLRHPSSICPDDCDPFTFMCGGTIQQFNNCDISRINDIDYGVFSQTFCVPVCHCDLWADESPVYPDSYTCPPPDNVRITLETDNPNPVLNCMQYGEEAIITVTMTNNSQAANRNIRALINNENNDHVEFVLDPTLDFNCIRTTTSGSGGSLITREFRIVDPVEPGCEAATEVLHAFAPGETKEFKFKVRYLGGILPNGMTNAENDITVMVYSGNSPVPAVAKTDISMRPFVEINDLENWDYLNPLFFKGDIELNGELPPNASVYDFSPHQKLLFAPGVGLTVGNHASSMIGMEIGGCSTMWKGITVRGLSSLVIEASTIRDAHHAISAEKRSNITVENSYLHNNNFAVITSPIGVGAYNFTLIGNEYGTTDSGLKPAYANQSPAPFGKGFAGIYLENAGPVNIGSAAGQPNRFYNLKYGIIAKNTDMTVRNASFSDFTDVPPGAGYENYVNTFGNDYPTGKAIYALGGKLAAKGGGIISGDKPLTFGNCHTGVEAKSAGLSVEECMMRSVNNGIRAGAGINKPYYVAWNDIEASERGISVFYVSGLPGQSAIAHNLVRMVNNPKGVGISVGGQDMFPQNEGLILKNAVTVIEGATGINIGVAQNLKATENVVRLAGPNALYGIKLEGGDRNTVNCNDIYNPGGGDNDGLYAVHAGRARVVCNNAENTARGLHFEGMLSGKLKPHVSGNRMANNASAGLLLGSDAVIGPQRHQGNRWINAGAMASAAAANHSIFTVDSDENAEFLPDAWSPSGWFEDISDPAVSYQCLPGTSCPFPALMADAGLDLKIARGELLGLSYQPANIWLAQRRFYERIVEEGNPYPGNTDVDTFIAETESNGMADYAGIQIGIRNLGALSENDRIAAAGSLLAVNNILTGDASFQVNEKTVNGIFLETIAVGNINLTGSQRTTLENIAALCPLSDGEAVLRARAILALVQDEVTHYDDLLICNSGERSVSIPKLPVNSDHPSLRMYPNPSKGDLTITYRGLGESDKQLILFNTIGQVVREITLSAGEYQIHLSLGTLPDGIYWYKIPGFDKITGKLIINH